MWDFKLCLKLSGFKGLPKTVTYLSICGLKSSLKMGRGLKYLQIDQTSQDVFLPSGDNIDN